MVFSLTISEFLYFVDLASVFTILRNIFQVFDFFAETLEILHNLLKNYAIFFFQILALATQLQIS